MVNLRQAVYFSMARSKLETLVTPNYVIAYLPDPNAAFNLKAQFCLTRLFFIVIFDEQNLHVQDYLHIVQTESWALMIVHY